MVRCEAKDVNVDIAGDCDGCSGVFCEYCVDCCLELVGEVRVPVGSAVEADDGVEGVGQLFVAVDLEDNAGGLRDLDVGEDFGEEAVFVVHSDVGGVYWLVPFEFVAVGIGVGVEVVI